MPLDIALGSLHVIEHRFAFDKPQKLQAASRVVIREHGAIRATILKPMMFLAIDLDQFAEVGPLGRFAHFRP